MSNPDSEAPGSALRAAGVERRILFFTCVGHTLTHVFIHFFTAIQPQMRSSFEISDEGLTRIGSISLALFGIGAIPSGWLSDRYGEKPLLVAFYLLSALGALCVGTATSAWMLGVGFALVGIGTSIYHPVALAMISKGMRSPGKAMGVNGLFGSLGTAFSPLIAAGVTALTGDWRWAFLGLVAPTIIIGLWMAKSDLGGKLDQDISEETAGSEDDGAKPSTRRSLYQIMTLLLIAMFFGGVYYALVITKLPDQLALAVKSETFQRDIVKKAWLPFVVYLVGGASQILGGFLITTREGRGMYVIVLLISTPLIYALGVLSGGALVATACVMAFFMFAVQPIENTLLARYSPPALRGRLFGLKFIIVFGAGMGGGTWLSGWVVERYDLAAVFTAAAIATAAALVAAIAAYLIRSKK